MRFSRIAIVSVLVLALCCSFAMPAFAKHGGSGSSQGATGGWGGAAPENPGAWASGQHPHATGVESSGIVEYVKTILIVMSLL